MSSLTSIILHILNLSNQSAQSFLFIFSCKNYTTHILPSNRRHNQSKTRTFYIYTYTMTIKRQRSAAQLISSLTIPVMVVNSFTPKLQHLPSNPAAKQSSMPRSTTCITFSTKEQENDNIPSFHTAISCPSFPELLDSDAASATSTVFSNDSSIVTPEKIVAIGGLSSLPLQTPTQRGKGKSLTEHLVSTHTYCTAYRILQ